MITTDIYNCENGHINTLGKQFYFNDCNCYLQTWINWFLNTYHEDVFVSAHTRTM